MADSCLGERRQTWSADSYDRHARFVSDLAGDIMSWLAPQPGERILDLGCGDGVLTLALMVQGARVTGVDASADFVSAARGRGVDAWLMDGEALDFNEEFDAVFSNAALHWMTDADAVAAGMARALRRGGRLVAEFGGHGNVAAIVTAMRAVALRRGGDVALAHPWYFPSSWSYQALLARHSFEVRRIALVPRPTPLATGMAEWLMLFRGQFFAQFGVAADEALAETVELLKPQLCDDGGQWTADYVRLRVEAVKP